MSALRLHVWLVRSALGFLIAVAALPGCASPPSPAGVEPVVSAEPGAEPVVVGALVSLSGRFSREGALLRDGYETWAAAVNEAGGVRIGSSRRPVRLVVRNDHSEPLAALPVVDGLVREDRARFILGPHSSALTLAAAAAAERLGALTVAPDASSPHVYNRGLRSLVSILPTDDTLFYGLLELANEVTPRARPIALVGPDEPAFLVPVEGAKTRATELSLDPPIVETYVPGSREVSTNLDRMWRVRPRLFVFAGETEQIAAVDREMKELKMDPPMRALVDLGSLTSLAERPGAGLPGSLALEWWRTTSSESGPLFGSARDFSRRFQQQHGYPPPARSAAAAAAGLALQLALERAATMEPEAVRAAFHDLDVATFWGRLAWDASGRNRVGRLSILQATTSGRWTVYPPAASEFRLIYPSVGSSDRRP